jgi:hypothetical protein
LSAGVWQDQQVRAANERAGWKLCEHCNGTGNELYAMYRAGPKCGGDGRTGEPPFRVRVARKADRCRAWFGMTFGFGPHADGQARSRFVSNLRWAASHYLCIGQWFWDGRDNCHRCDAMPSDVDFLMRRVGFRRAECIDSGECQEAAEIEAESEA